MPDLGNHYAIGDTLLIPFQTKDGANAATDADSVPTYRIYERGGTTAVATGSSSKRDDANTTGYYEAEVTLSSASGFERGKFYVVQKFATIGGDTVTGYDTFYISGGLTSFAAITGWPTLADIEARLSDMGLTPPADATTNALIAAAVAAWDDATGYEPFLGTGDDETRYLTGEGSLIDFGGGITAVPTSLTINGYYNDAGTYTGGTALVVNRDYQLLPLNALAKGKPYTYAKLKRSYVWGIAQTFPHGSGEGGVKIVASFGYAETVPADAWEAVMDYILNGLLIQSGVAISGGLSEWAEADTRERYGAEGPIPSAVNFFETRHKATLLRYRRITVM